jgi:hypothetical protein
MAVAEFTNLLTEPRPYLWTVQLTTSLLDHLMLFQLLSMYVWVKKMRRGKGSHKGREAVVSTYQWLQDIASPEMLLYGPLGRY